MKRLFSIISLTLLILGPTSSALAVGLGVYGDVERGFTNYGGILGGDLQGWATSIGTSGGIIIDSAVANNQAFNYRFKIGGGLISENKQKFSHYDLIQTFGVSPSAMRGEMVRFWLGPRIGLHYLHGSYTISEPAGNAFLLLYSLPPMPNALSNIVLLTMLTPQKSKLDLFRGDIGLVLAGFNFNFAETFTISMEFGIKYGFTIGTIKSGSYSGDAYGEGMEGFAAIAFLFRFNDSYSAATAPTH